MTIQPGNGYNFVSSSQGTSLDIDKPWTPPIGDAMVFAVDLPLGNSSLPEQLVYGDGTGARPVPFQCQIVSINGNRYLQIAVGSIGYTSSAMPLIKAGAETRIMQAYANKVQICPSGTRNNGDLYPIYPYDDPSYSLTWWMEDGGGYELSDTSDPLTLWAFKWDVAPGVAPFSTSTVVNTGLPTLALIAASNTADTNKVAVDPGPSLYVQTMNVQKMTGYDHLPAPFPDSDWGHCHTSWLNPRKLGYSYKAIATITPSANTFAMVGGIERPGIPLVQNQVQHISLVGKASGGTALISCGGATSVIPFPVTDFWDPATPIYSNELTLAECLNSIPAITFTIDGNAVSIGFAGNVEVSRTTEGSYYVTFCNELAGLNPPQLTFNTAGVTAYTYDFDITQYHTGNIDLTTPMQTGMVQLRNVLEEDEADDPYNVNLASGWDGLVNKAECVACDGFAGDVVTDGMFNMTGATAIPVDYSIIAGCVPEPDTASHPFLVTHVSTAAGLSTYHIQSGTVNNLVPGNIATDITVSTAAYDVWLKVPFAAGVFPDTTGFEWDIGTPLPADTDAEGYIKVAEVNGATVTQLVTGSLWADRIKMGSQTATYFYARV
jgi:hypothetical protein